LAGEEQIPRCARDDNRIEKKPNVLARAPYRANPPPVQSSVVGSPRNAEIAAKNVFHITARGSDFFEARVIEEVSCGIFRLGYAVVTRSSRSWGASRACAIRRPRRGLNRPAGCLLTPGGESEAGHHASDNQRQYVAAIHVFQLALRIDSGDEHGRVFLPTRFCVRKRFKALTVSAKGKPAAKWVYNIPCSVDANRAAETPFPQTSAITTASLSSVRTAS